MVNSTLNIFSDYLFNDITFSPSNIKKNLNTFLQCLGMVGGHQTTSMCLTCTNIFDRNRKYQDHFNHDHQQTSKLKITESAS